MVIILVIHLLGQIAKVSSENQHNHHKTTELNLEG